MMIKDRLNEKKWRKIRRFFINKKIIYMESLTEEIIQELYFVPGVSYELIKELKKIHYMEYINRAKLSNENVDQTDKEASINCRKVLDQVTEITSEDNNVSNIKSYELKPEVDLNEKYWFANFPWEIVVDGLKVGNVLGNILHSRNIRTISDLMYALPISLSSNEKGISHHKVMEFNNHSYSRIKKFLNVESFSEAKNNGIMTSLTWENYYSKINLASFSANFPPELMNMHLISIIEMGTIECNKRILSRLKNETLEHFLLERNDFDFKGVAKKYVNIFLTQFFIYLDRFSFDTSDGERNAQIKIEERFPSYIETLYINQLGGILNKEDFLKLKNVSEKYSLVTLKEFTGQVLTLNDYIIILKIIKGLQVDYLTNFRKNILSLPAERQNIMLGRSLGETLEILGNEIGVTRERARQILDKFINTTIEHADKIAGVVEGGKGYFSKNDWIKVLKDEDTTMIIDWVLQEKSEKYEYFRVTGQYVRSSLLVSDWKNKLKEIIETHATNVGDIHELFEQTIQEIKNLNIQFLNEENFTTYLTLFLNYTANHGAYIKHGVNTSEILTRVIEDNFTFDIKLGANQNNEDLNRLKQIMREQFPSVKITDTNRNLSEIIKRSNRIILSGRGRYVVVSRVFLPKILKERIYNWVKEQNTTLTYNEVFEKFKGRLTMESNIDNRNFFHGAFQYFYEEEFKFERDTFSPLGQNVIRTDDRVHDLIHKYKILSIKDIQQKILGIKEYQIFAIIERSEELFNAGKSRISSTESIEFSKDQNKLLYNTLYSELKENKGFTSAKVLFKRLLDAGMIREDSMLNEVGIFQYIKIKSKGKLKMRYPYIFINGILPNEDKITFSEVINHFFIKDKNIIDRSQIEKFCRKYGLSDLSVYSFFQESAGKLLRLSKDTYVPITRSNISKEMIDNVDIYLSKTIHDFMPIIDFKDYNILPDFGHQWNAFMLEDVLDKFGSRIRLIDRTVNFSHHISSIIVATDSKFYSYEDIVIYVIELNRKKSLGEHELLTLLQSYGLTSVAIPRELSDGEHLWFNPRSNHYEIR